MKNTFGKTDGRRLDVAAALPHTAHGIDDSSATVGWQGTVSCRNLRPGSERGRLVPVDDFTTLAKVGAGSTPLLCWHHPGRGECLLLKNGNMLTIVTGCDREADAVSCHTTAPLASAPLCAVTEGDGSRVAVMTEIGAFYLSADETDGVWSVEEARPEFAAATFIADSYSTLTADVAETKLKGTYSSTSHRLEKSDRAALADDVTTAMEELESLARSAGRSIAPLLLRYRLTDADGRTLFLSPVVMTGTDKGYQPGEEMTVTVSGNGDTRRAAFSIAAESFVPTLLLPDAAGDDAARRVKRLEVEAAGPLHAVDQSGIIADNLDMEAHKLRFYMPGMAVTMTGDTAKLRDTVLSALARFDSICEKVAAVSDPFATENLGKKIVLSVPCGGLTAAECHRRLTRAFAKAPRTRLPHETMLAGGGWRAAAFTAGTAATNGDTTIWGNITALPFERWGAAHFATATATERSWTGTLSVERKEGRATCNSAGYGDAPTQLSPLIVWPGEEGGTLTVRVKTAEGTASTTVILTPIAGSGLSAWLSPTLRPLQLSYTEEETFRVEASTVGRKTYTGAIVSAPASDSLAPSGMTGSPGHRIAGITTATALSSAWDFSRDRFYVFGESGINLCVTNARHEPVALQLIDKRAVKSRRDIAQGTADRGVAVIAGGCAVNVRGSKTTDFPGITPADAQGIGWDGGDLWIMLAGGMAQVRPSEAPDHFYLRDTPLTASAMSSGDGCLRIIDNNGKLRDSRHREQSEKEVEWSCRVELPDYVATPTRGALGSVLRLTSIGLAMVASAVKARLTATTDGGAASIALVRLLLSAMISGTMKESLFLPVNAGRRHWFTIGLKGTVSPDMRLSGISLHMK